MVLSAPTAASFPLIINQGKNSSNSVLFHTSMRENSYFPCGVSEPGLNLGFLPLGAFAELLANVLLDSFNVFPRLVLETLVLQDSS